MLHPSVPESLRGTYSALASPTVIEYLKSLGVTAVELLPVHQHVDDRFLVDKGLTNYWGYNTLSFFAPNTRYASQTLPGSEVREFKAMVKALHDAGIEVILDVVYNHTAEGNHLGPTLSFRGIDNESYYRLVPSNERYYMDYTGCGNTLNVLDTRTLQLIMDSLRYWVTEMHVDGFRFDLAAALMRGLHEADRLSAFFDVITQDPVISQVKLIAEPWDVGPGGYAAETSSCAWQWRGRPLPRRYRARGSRRSWLPGTARRSGARSTPSCWRRDGDRRRSSSARSSSRSFPRREAPCSDREGEGADAMPAANSRVKASRACQLVYT
jgi:glycogen operon protein